MIELDENLKIHITKVGMKINKSLNKLADYVQAKSPNHKLLHHLQVLVTKDLNQTEIEPWIRIKDKLPPLGEEVLIFRKTSYGARIESSKFGNEPKFDLRLTESEFLNYGITHWRPTLEHPPEG